MSATYQIFSPPYSPIILIFCSVNAVAKFQLYHHQGGVKTSEIQKFAILDQYFIHYFIGYPAMGKLRTHYMAGVAWLSNDQEKCLMT